MLIVISYGRFINYNSFDSTDSDFLFIISTIILHTAEKYLLMNESIMQDKYSFRLIYYNTEFTLFCMEEFIFFTDSKYTIYFNTNTNN